MESGKMKQGPETEASDPCLYDDQPEPVTVCPCPPARVRAVSEDNGSRPSPLDRACRKPGLRSYRVRPDLRRVLAGFPASPVWRSGRRPSLRFDKWTMPNFFRARKPARWMKVTYGDKQFRAMPELGRHRFGAAGFPTGVEPVNRNPLRTK